MTGAPARRAPLGPRTAGDVVQLCRHGPLGGTRGPGPRWAGEIKTCPAGAGLLTRHPACGGAAPPAQPPAPAPSAWIAAAAAQVARAEAVAETAGASFPAARRIVREAAR
jgi:hypothetical protein